VAIDGLNASDPGFGLLAEAVRDVPADEVIGVASPPIAGLPGARRRVVDVRELSDPAARLLQLAPPSEATFGHALVWPRAHLGKDFTFACLAYAALSVREGGRVWCAVRKAKGADSVGRELAEAMGSVEVVARARGYRLLVARRSAALDVARATARLSERYEITDPILGTAVLRSSPGVFSRRELDAGTRCLLEHARAARDPAPTRLLDLGAGIGPISVFAGLHWPDVELLAVEPNGLAYDNLVANLASHGLAGRATVVHAAGLRGVAAAAALRGRIDRALVNPPTHLDVEDLSVFVAEVLQWLRPGGRVSFVVSRADALAVPLRRAGVAATVHPYERYTVIDAQAG
jgi:16S rRNA (guanine1207-N2)-methyltransferase